MDYNKAYREGLQYKDCILVRKSPDIHSYKKGDVIVLVFSSYQKPYLEAFKTSGYYNILFESLPATNTTHPGSSANTLIICTEKDEV